LPVQAATGGLSRIGRACPRPQGAWRAGA